MRTNVMSESGFVDVHYLELEGSESKVTYYILISLLTTEKWL